MAIKKDLIISGTEQEILDYFKEELNYVGNFLEPRPPKECSFDFGKLSVPRQVEEIAKQPFSSGSVFYMVQEDPETTVSGNDSGIPEINIFVDSIDIKVIPEETKKALEEGRMPDSGRDSIGRVAHLFPELNE